MHSKQQSSVNLALQTLHEAGQPNSSRNLGRGVEEHVSPAGRSEGELTLRLIIVGIDAKFWMEDYSDDKFEWATSQAE
jgi:hypothetical protein